MNYKVQTFFYLKMRDKIAYYFTLVLGIVLLLIQTYKYFTNDLITDDIVLNTGQIVVFCIGFLLVWKPSKIVEFINKRNGDKNGRL